MAEFATSWIPGSILVTITRALVRVSRLARASGPFRWDIGNTVKPARRIPTIEQKYVIASVYYSVQ